MATADGITGGSITSSGTIKANLKSYTKNTAEIGGKLYGVELDKNGKLAVNVPWTDTHADISNLVPYTGASKDVDLGNHSLLISDKTDTRGTMIKVSGKGISEDDVWTTIEPYGINIASPSISYAYLGSSALTVSDGAQSGSVTETGFKVTTPEDTSVYGYDGITYNDKKLSFPAKAGTIALTSDLSTLLNKGTSSTSSVDFQTVYNPVTFMLPTTTPSIQGIHTSVGAVGFPWELGGTTSTSSVSSALTLRGYEDSLKKECYTILTQDGNEFSIKAKNDSMSSILSYNGQWRIGGHQIVTADMMPGTQQWTLTDVNGNAITVNICVK